MMLYFRSIHFHLASMKLRAFRKVVDIETKERKSVETDTSTFKGHPISFIFIFAFFIFNFFKFPIFHALFMPSFSVKHERGMKTSPTSWEVKLLRRKYFDS